MRHSERKYVQREKSWNYIQTILTHSAQYSDILIDPLMKQHHQSDPSPCWSQSEHFHREPLCISSTMLQCSGRVYSPESWTLDDWQLSFMTTEATEILLIKNMTLISVLIWTLLCCCFTGKVQRIKLLSSMNIRPSEMKPTKPWRCFLFVSLYPQSPEASSQWLSLQQWHLLCGAL